MPEVAGVPTRPTTITVDPRGRYWSVATSS
jgi:hypothetical protein